MKKVEFMKLITILEKNYDKKFDKEKIALWYLQLKNVDYTDIAKAIDVVIKLNKFMPTIAEVLEKVNKARQTVDLITIQKMKDAGYFKHPSEIDKIMTWLIKGIVPNWFKEDMKKYQNLQLSDKTKLLENFN